MSDFKIEDGVEMPNKQNKAYKYPFAFMDVGQSFFVANAPRCGDSVRTAAGSYGRRHSVKFTVRMVTENGVRGARCWRIK